MKNFVLTKIICAVLRKIFSSIVQIEFILQCLFLRRSNFFCLTLLIKKKIVYIYLHVYVHTIGMYSSHLRAVKHGTKLSFPSLTVLLRYFVFELYLFKYFFKNSSFNVECFTMVIRIQSLHRI